MGGWFTLIGLGAGLGLAVKPLLEPREKKIIGNAVDLDDGNPHLVMNSDDYKKIAKTEHGSLHNRVMTNKKTGQLYIKKGAHSEGRLVKEIFIANIFALIEPNLQPQTGIMQKRHLNGRARFFTMSKVFENSMDLESFIRQDDWKEKLQKKPLIGLDVAIAKDFIAAKQQDMKFQNYLVVEKEHAYVVVSIDHELAGENFYRSLNRVEFSVNIDAMIQSIRDLHNPQDPDFPGSIGGLTSDPRGTEFIKAVRGNMREENIVAYYKAFGEADFQPVFDQVEALRKENTGLITKHDCGNYRRETLALQKKAREFVYIYENKERPSLR